MTLRCERSDKYTKTIWKLKQDDTSSRRCECSFKLCGYLMVNNTWTFNVIYGIQNPDMYYNLVGHLIAYGLNPKEDERVSDMTLNMVQPKNILATLKLKRPQNVSYIKQVYNIHTRNNETIRDPTVEMKQLLNLLDDSHYLSRCIVCEDGETV